MTDTDDDLPFSDHHPIEPPTVTGWRREPPTLDEFRRWPYWWICRPCCAPVLLGFGRSGSPLDATDGEPPDPEDLVGALWAPAVPPASETP